MNNQGQGFNPNKIGMLLKPPPPKLDPRNYEDEARSANSKEEGTKTGKTESKNVQLSQFNHKRISSLDKNIRQLQNTLLMKKQQTNKSIGLSSANNFDFIVKANNAGEPSFGD